MNSAIIVIPIYKPIPDLSEIIAFKQCIKILFRYPICIVTHKRLNLSYYTNLLTIAKVVFSVEYFEKSFFESIAGYNRLLLSVTFYLRFKRYDYMLIHQLDAYVFRDELDFWCKQGYDYIGAPWIEDHKDDNDKPVLSCVGNGGYSLRNIHKYYELARHIKKLQLLDRFLRYSFLSKILPADRLLLSFWKTAFEPKPPFSIKMLTSGFYANNEDGNWSINIALGSKDFIVADINLALRFSFEKNPEFLFEKNNRQLPFGCHAFRKYNWTFWSQYIDVTPDLD